MTIAPCTHADIEEWLVLRSALWNDAAGETADALRLLGDPERYCNLIAREDGVAVGFAEASIRNDYVNGCDTSPVLFLEGIYVDPRFRKRGVARALVDACAAWGLKRGVREFASDAYEHDTDSQGMHAALGFVEMERVVYFRRTIS